MMGPFQTPMALAREPLMAFFWAVLAPVLFLYGAALLASSFIPAFDAGSPEEIRAYHTLWFTTAIATAAWFALMSAWSQWLGAGAFAGVVTTKVEWVLIAALLGPVFLLVPNILVDSLMTEEGWQFSGEVNREIFAPENWSLAFIFTAVFLAPVVEEIAFRGIAFGALIARGMSSVGAAVLSSFAFAFIHLQYTPAAMFVVFLTGLGFAVLRAMSGTVIVPILAHMSANAVVLTLNSMATNPPT